MPEREFRRSVPWIAGRRRTASGRERQQSPRDGGARHRKCGWVFAVSPVVRRLRGC